MRALIAALLLAPTVPAAGSGIDEVLARAEWRVRDVAAGSPFKSADAAGNVPGSNLTLKVGKSDDKPVWTSTCTVIDATASDRAVTLAYCIPIDATGGLWWDDPVRSRRITGKGEYANLVDNGLGATGFVSRYPLAVVSKGEEALCLALPIEPPRMARLVYDAGRKELRAEFDLGLSKVCTHFPSSADASVIAYPIAETTGVSGFERERKSRNMPDASDRSGRVPSRPAFRRALERYWQLYPEAFKRRVANGGIWMPFAPLSVVERPEDFGFAFRETTDSDVENVKQDHKLGVASFVYTEPMTDWRAFRASGPKTYAGYMKELWDDALEGDKSAQATLTSGAKLADGRFFLYLTPVAYTPLSPFGVNCDPDVPIEDWPAWPNRAQYESERLAKPLGWTGEPAYGLEGVYVDSMESGWSLGNYNRDHWRVTRCPLTFDPTTRKLCLANFWGNYAFIKELSGKLHARGMRLMGNDAFYRYWFLAPFVDIPGREYSWYEGDRFTPVPDERYMFFRAMAGSKPYLMLMNNRFDDGSHMEEYFQRSLFWAVYPSMFHGHTSEKEVPYFYNPVWYNRDRELFRKYIPLIRKLDLAGWEPVTCADVTPAHIRVERYGRWPDNNLAFTLHNPTANPASVRLTLPCAPFAPAQSGVPDSQLSTLHSQLPSAVEWITGKSLPISIEGDNCVLRLDLPANGYGVVGIGFARD